MFIFWMLIALCIIGMLVSAYGLGEYRASRRYYFPLKVEGAEEEVQPQEEPMPEVSLYLATHTGEINVIPTPPAFELPSLGVEDQVILKSDTEVIRELRDQIDDLEHQVASERSQRTKYEQAKQRHWRTIERLRVKLKAIEQQADLLNQPTINAIINWSYSHTNTEVRHEKVYRASARRMELEIRSMGAGQVCFS